MTIIANDTKNEFGDAWGNNTAGSTTPAAQAYDANMTNETNAYRAAWDRENHGIYGDLNVPGAAAAVAAQAAPVAAPKSKFRQQSYGLSALEQAMQANGHVIDVSNRSPDQFIGIAHDGGYGSFNYGDQVPQAGSDAYRDMSEYFALGGVDPGNYYGKAARNSGYANAWNMGGANPGHGNSDGAAASGASASSAASAAAGQDGAGAVGVGVL